MALEGESLLSLDMSPWVGGVFYPCPAHRRTFNISGDQHCYPWGGEAVCGRQWESWEWSQGCQAPEPTLGPLSHSVRPQTARGLEAVREDPYTGAGGVGIPSGLMALEGVRRGSKTGEEGLRWDC